MPLLDLSDAPARRSGQVALNLSRAPLRVGENPDTDLTGDYGEPEAQTFWDIIKEVQAKVSPAPASTTAQPGTAMSAVPVPVTPDELAPKPRPEPYSPLDPNDPLIQRVMGLGKNAVVGAQDALLSIVALPFYAATDPSGTVKGMLQYLPEQWSRLVNADLLNLGPVAGDKEDPEWEKKRDEARAALYADPLGPLFSYGLLKGTGALVKAGPQAIVGLVKKVKQRSLAQTADALLGEDDPATYYEFVKQQRAEPAPPPNRPSMAGEAPAIPTGPITDPSRLLPALPSNVGEGFTMTPPPTRSRLAPPGAGMNVDFSAEAKPGGAEVGLSLEVPEARGSLGTAPPGNYMDFLTRLKAEKGTASGLPEPPARSFRVRLEPGVKEPDFVKPEPPTVPTLAEIGERLSKRSPEIVATRQPEALTDMPSVGFFRRFVADIPRTEMDKLSREAVYKWSADLELQRYNLGRFVSDAKSKFKKSELRAMRYHLQRTLDPKTSATPQLSPEATKFADEVLRPRMDEIFKNLVESGYLDDAAYVKNFVSQFWSKRRVGKGGKGFRNLVMQTRKGRKIPSYYEGETAYGMKPLFETVLEDLAAYEELNARVILNNELVKTLRGMKDGEGNPLLAANTKKSRPLLDAGWELVDSRPLNRAVYATKPGKRGPVTIATYPATVVHPEIARAVKRVFTETWQEGDNPVNKLYHAYRTVNSTAKALQLSLSLFHPFALAESSFGVGGVKGAVIGWHQGLKMATENPGFVKEFADVGGQLGAPYDISRSVIRNMLIRIEARARGKPVAAQAATAVRSFNDVFQKTLWDKYQTGLKLYSYWKMKSFLLEKNPSANPRLVMEEAAKFANDAFGGQNWDRMLVNPHVQEFMHAVLLAPDWGISNIKQLGRLAEGSWTGALRAKFGKLEGSVADEFVLRSQLQGQMGRRFWARTALYNFLGLQMLNYVFSGARDDMEAHFTWDNDPGQEFGFVTPFSDDKGRVVYAHPNKQTREVVRWGTEPIVNLGQKMTPLIREAGAQFTSHDVGTGFPMPWVEEPITGIRPTFWESVPKRAEHALSAWVPFSFHGNNFAFTLPAGVGMTADRFLQMYMEALEDGNQGQMKRLELSGKLNNLNVWQLTQVARSRVNRAQRQPQD